MAKAERDRFYSSKRWRDLRIEVLKAHPLCVRCLASGLVVEATTVHHVRERLEHPALAFDRANLEASCNPCHTGRHKAKETAPK